VYRRAQFIEVEPPYQDILCAAGIGASEVFTHPAIIPWRTLPDRDNCTLDLRRPSGAPVRLHVKRYRTSRPWHHPARDEVRGLLLLRGAGVPAAELAAWGELADGRSFIMIADLAGYRAGDKLVSAGLPFESILIPTARVAAALHNAGLHHRDLYLCHFFVAADPPGSDIRLIDAARVRPLPPWPFRRRWIVKDLAQFCYSLTQLGIADDAQRRWLECYSRLRDTPLSAGAIKAIRRKVLSIARHDRRLRSRQPLRNISIPEA